MKLRFDNEFSLSEKREKEFYRLMAVVVGLVITFVVFFTNYQEWKELCK